MKPKKFFKGRVVLYGGDCLVMMKKLKANSVDSIVCDPPYHLTSIVKRFGKPDSAPVKVKLTNGQKGSPFARGAKGFMGKQWDGGDIAFQVDLWREVLRVLKPGGHLVAFGGTRTFARMSVAIEDAGFEIRDTLMWLYGSGFPKSHDVSKGIDRRAKAVREVVHVGRTRSRGMKGRKFIGGDGKPETRTKTAPSSNSAKQWEGWGTALKPAVEPIVLARKPFGSFTVAENVLAHGTGALNIDGCKIEAVNYTNGGQNRTVAFGQELGERQPRNDGSQGRWPANVIHDGSKEVVGAFPESDHARGNTGQSKGGGGMYGHAECTNDFGAGDSGSAARFFYTAKANSDDRLGSKHPTVKPVDLMRWLVRLVTPKGGTILDPFAGTGTTAEAAYYEGFSCLLIEREKEYLRDIERRMKLILAGPDERARESIKEKLKDKPLDMGPLFGGGE